MLVREVSTGFLPYTRFLNLRNFNAETTMAIGFDDQIMKFHLQ